MAIACLPTMSQAKEIDGESCCDGGYSGNPMIMQLVRECQSRDTMLVQINPFCAKRSRPPRAIAISSTRLAKSRSTLSRSRSCG